MQYELSTIRSKVSNIIYYALFRYIAYTRKSKTVYQQAKKKVFLKGDRFYWLPCVGKRFLFYFLKHMVNMRV